MNQYWILKKVFGKKQGIKRKGKMKCLNVSVQYYILCPIKIEERE